MTLRVAVVGDSAMWGQGLKLEHQFARIAAQQIADDLGEQLQILPGMGDEPGRGYPRSGAKIRSESDDNFIPVLLPSGTTTSADGDRANFALTFREYFLSDQSMLDFLNGINERPAAEVFGEIPATFPTVTSQIHLLTEDGPTADVGLVILNGGANDVNFEQVINPTGPNLDLIDREIRKVFGRYLPRLLVSARHVFPNAIIVVAGYYAAFSQFSHKSEIKAMFEYIKGAPGWQVGLNAALNDVPFIKDLWDSWEGVDEDALVRAAIWRTVHAAALAHFRTREAIGSLAPEIKGPGILYAHPGLLPKHVLFTGESPLLHSGYKVPHSGTLSVADEMLHTRLAHIHRLELVNEFNDILYDASGVEQLMNSHDTDAEHLANAVQTLRDKVTALKTLNTDLPGQILLATAGPYYADLEELVTLMEALTVEVGRIELAEIASFIHPNPDGAEYFARSIVTVCKRHRRFSVREATQGIASAGRSLFLGERCAVTA